MKNNKINLLFGLLMFSCCALMAQDYAFKVLANKGSNQVKSGETLMPIKTGAKLKATDEITVSENAYLGLVHISGKPIEIKRSGNYKVKDLADKVGPGSSVLAKYTDFILSSNSAEAKKNRLSATGAVHRGLEDIKLMLPESHNAVFNDSITITWEAKATGPYVVTLKNLFDEELYKKEVESPAISVSLKEPKLAKETPILIEVRSKSEVKSKSEQRIVKRLPAKEFAEVKTMLSDVEKEFTEDSSFKQLLLAGFYEQHHLLIDAMACYQKSIKMSPDVPSYKEDYDEFLLRNRLKVVK